jgi:hypothetical protein
MSFTDLLMFKKSFALKCNYLDKVIYYTLSLENLKNRKVN